jgi:putative holliday junction resolvase
VIVGIDPGERRVGVAAADLETRFARPVEVIDRRSVDAVKRIIDLVRELGADLIVVGRPTGLSGDSGPAVAAQQQFVAELIGATSVEVREYDERFTSTVAERALRAAGKNAKEMKAQRDSVAAQIMLQDYLDATRPSPNEEEPI